MIARILDEAIDSQSNVEQPRQPVLEPCRNEAVLTSVENNVTLDPNDCDTFPVDSEAFLEWFDSVDWNNSMGFYNLIGGKGHSHGSNRYASTLGAVLCSSTNLITCITRSQSMNNHQRTCTKRVASRIVPF